MFIVRNSRGERVDSHEAPEEAVRLMRLSLFGVEVVRESDGVRIAYMAHSSAAKVRLGLAA